MAKAQLGAKRQPVKAAVKTRNRRPPVDVLADLKAKRADLAQRLGDRLAKLDARIERLETRYEMQIKLAELTNGMSADQLIVQLEETRNLQKLLRMAMKTKN
jgi:hypothetical protein